MCGIAGGHLPDDRPSLAQTVGAMADTLSHRGPDGQGTWIHPDGALGFAHRRLSIIDLSPAGRQPMASAGGQLVITFNGEIYNYAELRAALGGHVFRGHSDTEVLLAGIEAWGLEATLARCIGMFAFALWDARARAVFLVRDRIGIKPLYFTQQGRRFVFGSELKALREAPGFAWDMDRQALSQYFRHGYIPAPLSIFSGVHKVLPGSIVRLGLTGEPPVTTRYWDAARVASTRQHEPSTARPEDVAEQFEALLTDAVRLHMVADVPVGAFLSGGIDSSTVVSLMRAHTSRRVQTFTIGFREREFDEARHARAIAKRLDTDHHELYVTEGDLLRSIDRIVDTLDEPFADISILPTLLVSKLAVGSVKAVLSGDGGDELFFGYEHYQRTLRASRLRGRVPRRLRRPIGRALRRFNGGLGRTARLGGVLAAEGSDALYTAMVSRCQTPSALVRGGIDLPWPDPAQRLTEFPHQLSNFMMLRDLRTYLMDDVLQKVDRASMAVSLEARVPLLDHRVVEFAWGLPLERKWVNGATKWPLRQVLAKYVPPALFDRPKWGFAVPISSWLRGGLRAWAEDLLYDSQMSADLNASRVRRLWREHLSGRLDRGAYVWDILCFLSWRRRQFAQTSTSLHASRDRCH
jgi:asparagine synthase (glutamine-hydrolysing)